MNTSFTLQPNATTASEIFAGALARTLAVSAAVVGFACVFVAWIVPSHLTATLSIALASIVISAASLTPGMMCRVPSDGNRSRSSVKLNSQLFLLGTAVAMGVRFTGTVALFVVCRYQFGLTEGAIAFHICVWYATLTSLEIFFLAHGASAIDSVVQTDAPNALGVSKPVTVAADSFRFSQTPLTDSTIG